MPYTNEQVKAMLEYAHNRGLKMSLQTAQMCMFIKPGTGETVTETMDTVLALYRNQRRQEQRAARRAPREKNESDGPENPRITPYPLYIIK